MGIVDAFSAEERIPMRFSEMYALVKEAAKAEMLTNAVNTDVPYRYIREMLTGVPEKMPRYSFNADDMITLTDCLDDDGK